MQWSFKTLAPVIAFAARGGEAGFFGLGGDRTGDAIYRIPDGRVVQKIMVS